MKLSSPHLVGVRFSAHSGIVPREPWVRRNKFSDDNCRKRLRQPLHRLYLRLCHTLVIERPEAARRRGKSMMKIVAGNSNRPLAEAICSYLHLPQVKAVVKRFNDMEVFV